MATISSLNANNTDYSGVTSTSRASERRLGQQAEQVADRVELSSNSQRLAVSNKSPSMAQLPNITGRTPPVVPNAANLAPPATQGQTTASFGGTVSLLDQRAVQTARMPNIDITFGGPGPSGKGAPATPPPPTMGENARTGAQTLKSPGQDTNPEVQLKMPGAQNATQAELSRSQQSQQTQGYGQKGQKTGGLGMQIGGGKQGQMINFLA